VVRNSELVPQEEVQRLQRVRVSALPEMGVGDEDCAGSRESVFAKMKVDEYQT
jgi:hypothetical protein